MLDFATGDEVCGQCGLVTGSAMTQDIPPAAVHYEEIPSKSPESPFAVQYSPIYEADLSPPSSQPKPTPDFQKKLKNLLSYSSRQWEMEERRREEICQACSLMNLDNDLVMETAYRILLRIEKVLNDGGKHQNLRPKAEHIATALVEALNQENIPRSPKTVAQCCGILPSKMLNIQKTLMKSADFMNEFANAFADKSPKLYVETLCDMLYVPFRVTKIIKVLVEQIEDDFQMSHPESLVASSTLLVCKALRQLESTSPVIRKLKHDSLHIDPGFIRDELEVTKKCIQDTTNRIPRFILSTTNDTLQITFKNNHVCSKCM